MSKFDAAGWFDSMVGGAWLISKDGAKSQLRNQVQFKQIIAVLEAAGKVDKDKALKVIGKSDDYWDKGDETIFATIVDLLEALPDIEEKPKRYRCERCGKEFDDKLFSHSRAEDDGKGNPVEVECGPITRLSGGGDE